MEIAKLKNLISILETYVKVKEEEEEDSLDDVTQMYEECMSWAFGENYADIGVNNCMKKWKELHPNLPEIILPPFIKDSVVPMVTMMQIAPHWDKSKQKEKS